MEDLDLNPSFWRSKRVFLTGHTGFKGSWLSLWLQELGAEVTGYALSPPTIPSLFESANIGDGMRSIIGDVRDRKLLENTVTESKPEIIIHMAAQPLVRESYQFPAETFEANVQGTVCLLEAVRATPSVKAVVNVTTDKCYENKEWHWGYRECDPLGGHDPYSASKACSEIVANAYRSSYFGSSLHQVALATARAGNVIGGGDWGKDRLMTDLIHALTQGETVQIRNPNAVRPWQHVLEPLRGYLMLAERLYNDGNAFSEAWNFGPYDQDAKSVSWIVDELSKFWNSTSKYNIQQGYHPQEAKYLKLDISKAKSRLGWLPKIKIKDALFLTANWTMKVIHGSKARDITMDQIRTYQKEILDHNAK